MWEAENANLREVKQIFAYLQSKPHFWLANARKRPESDLLEDLDSGGGDIESDRNTLHKWNYARTVTERHSVGYRVIIFGHHIADHGFHRATVNIR